MTRRILTSVVALFLGALRHAQPPVADLIVSNGKIFQENNLGSIQPGKLADLLVLDRDYLTVPADQIKDIKPVLTMVGGRVVYDAAAETATK